MHDAIERVRSLSTKRSMPLSKIISGGQTGVDRGALDAALALSFPCGGWCPKGRRAEDGTIPLRYPVAELPGRAYRPRTKRNVQDSDGTLIIYFGDMTGGTRETLRLCERLGKPVLSIDAVVTPEAAGVKTAVDFITDNSIAVLNVAGPRETSHAGATEYAARFVTALLMHCATTTSRLGSVAERVGFRWDRSFPL